LFAEHAAVDATRRPDALNLGDRLTTDIIMQVQDHAEIVHLLAELKLEHRDLDGAIEQLSRILGRDELQLTRLKKRKLLLKDQIARLESKLIPDLDA
jgi:hypothetical protein